VIVVSDNNAFIETLYISNSWQCDVLGQHGGQANWRGLKAKFQSPPMKGLMIIFGLVGHLTVARGFGRQQKRARVRKVEQSCKMPVLWKSVAW